MSEALTAARAALAETEARLAAADRVLADAVRDAYRSAVDSIRRLEAVRSDIDAAVARRRTDSAAAGREFGRFLLEKNREITAIVDEARSESHARTRELQSLIGRYTG